MVHCSRILVTGANGFVGQIVVDELCRNTAFVVRAATRKPTTFAKNVETVTISDIGPDTDWTTALRDVDCVVHLAGKAHAMNGPEKGATASYAVVNTAGTLALATQAAKAGVRRFIFVSSIKVCGEGGPAASSEAYSEDSLSMEQDEYASSKHQAEIGLEKIVQSSQMRYTIVRPPLIFGPGMKGNLLALSRLISKGIPLPFGGVTGNRRSLISVFNLASFLAFVALDSRADNQTFNICDDEHPSTRELISLIGESMDKRPMLIPVPAWLLTWLATLVRPALAIRLFGSLRVNSSKAKELLTWKPPLSLREGLKRTFTPPKGAL